MTKEDKYTLSFFITSIITVFADDIFFSFLSLSFLILSILIGENSKFIYNIKRIMPLIVVFSYAVAFLVLQIVSLQFINPTSKTLSFILNSIEKIQVKEPTLTPLELAGLLYIILPVFLMFVLTCLYTCYAFAKKRIDRNSNLQLLRIGFYFYTGLFLIVDILQTLEIKMWLSSTIPKGLMVSLFSMYVAFDTAIYMFFQSKNISISENNSQSAAP